MNKPDVITAMKIIGIIAQKGTGTGKFFFTDRKSSVSLSRDRIK